MRLDIMQEIAQKTGVLERKYQSYKSLILSSVFPFHAVSAVVPLHAG